jgi:hypothetical protein
MAVPTGAAIGAFSLSVSGEKVQGCSGKIGYHKKITYYYLN